MLEPLDEVVRQQYARELSFRGSVHNWFDRRLSRGGWSVDVAHELPTRGPTKAQLAKYEKDQREYEAREKKSQALMDELVALIKKRGFEPQFDEDYEPFRDSAFD